MGFSLLLTAHHFLIYSRHVSDELARDSAAAVAAALEASTDLPHFGGPTTEVGHALTG
jgi:hypothetical protein